MSPREAGPGGSPSSARRMRSIRPRAAVPLYTTSSIQDRAQRNAVVASAAGAGGAIDAGLVSGACPIRQAEQVALARGEVARFARRARIRVVALTRLDRHARGPTIATLRTGRGRARLAEEARPAI